MAELVLKVGDQNPVGDHSTYQDGDIICAFNDHRIRCCHAEMICHVKNAGFNSNGLRPDVSLARTFLETTSQYCFERISKWEMRRTDLFAGTSEVLSNKPNSKGKQVYVPELVRRRLRHPRHRIFGAPGLEVWFGGRRDVSNRKLDFVWKVIEDETPLREKDYLLWPIPEEIGPVDTTLTVTPETRKYLIEKLHRPEPLEVQYFAADRTYCVGTEGSVVSAILGGEQAREHLFYPCDNMTDEQAEELVSSQTRDTGKVDKHGDPIIEIVVKSRHQIDWKALPGMVQADVEDKTKRVVMHDSVGPIIVNDVITTKPLVEE